MDRVTRVTVFLTAVITVSACAGAKPPATSESKAPSTPQTQTQTQSPPPATAPGELQVGQASGSYTAKGEVVELKYAYAGRGERFGTEAIIILVTDKPIPAEALAEELKSQTMLENEKIRGLEYVIDKDGMWVRFHPSQYQESTSNKLKEYAVEGDIVRGIDENAGDVSSGRYSRSVKFVAALAKS